jgi:hypothetical protein
MVGDLITYGLLAGIFVVQGLRLFMDRPGRPVVAPARPKFMLKRRSAAGDPRN